MSTYEKISSNKARLSFVVTPEEFEKALQIAYRKMVGRINIPGFRKGKTPRKVIEMQYGEGVFYDEAIDAIFPDLYRAAIAEHDIHPVDRPELDIQKIGNGEGCEFSVEVFVRPDVTLGDYKAIKVEKNVAEVTEDDVKAEVERARNRVARYIDVTDRAVKMDDQIKLDYAGFCGDEQFEGGTAQDQTLVIGSGSFIPGFEDQLVGAEIGKEVEVNVTFPTEYHAENLAGKEATFKCTVHSIQEKEMPELDDEFAKDVSEFDTLDAYKADIREKLVKRAEDTAEQQFENECVEKLVEGMEVEIPEAMIEDMVEDLMREMETTMMYQGFNMEMFCKYTGQTIEQIREQRKPEAENRVKATLALEALRRAENVEASEEDIDEAMKEYTESRQKSLEEYKATMSEGEKSYFTELANTRKTLDVLKNYAKAE